MNDPNSYDPEKFATCRALIGLNFRVLGYSWEHPRVKAYLQRVSDKIGTPVPSRHYLPFWAYSNLAEQLEKERKRWEMEQLYLVEVGDG